MALKRIKKSQGDVSFTRLKLKFDRKNADNNQFGAIDFNVYLSIIRTTDNLK